MATLLLLIIYLIFISLGLPDSLVASSWPAISQSLEISADFQGILTFVNQKSFKLAKMFDFMFL